MFIQPGNGKHRRRIGNHYRKLAEEYRQTRSGNYCYQSWQRYGNGNIGLSKKYIQKAVEDSLKRLQTDYIDLYQSHKDDLNTPVEETLEAYAELIKAGKVRVVGASNFTPERFSEALKKSSEKDMPRYESLQPEYNLYAREGFEKELEPLCENNNIGIIPYYGLASGFLTGKYRSEDDLYKRARRH